MNTESRPYGERKFLLVVREQKLLGPIVAHGAGLAVPIVKLGLEETLSVGR
jgi:hypothetical protein